MSFSVWPFSVRSFVVVPLVFATLSAAAGLPSLEDGFATPPNSAKPHTWYHMMNGNVTKAGITRDFEALAAAGVGGVQMFDAGCAIPAGPLKFNSAEWFDLFRHAQKEAKRLGLEICIPNCSGWSSSGGPWNTPAHAMKVTVFTETPVTGPARFSNILPRTKRDHGFYDDIAVLAYPTPDAGASIADWAKKIGLRRGGNTRDTRTFSRRQIVAKHAIVDLTAKMAPSGLLDWEVPPGRWTILRLGYACNGRCNHPASEKGRGLEVDKLSASAMDFHFSQYVARLCRTLGVSAQTDNSTGFNNILVDSYEVGCQNWTQGLAETFRARMGYALTPYLPVFAGRVVGSVEETDRFLEDFRRVLADLFAENYAGRLTKLCHDNGLMCSIEPYGSSNADDLQYGEAVDIPMAEYWSRVDDAGNNSGGTGNARFASYLAHVWGRRYAATESFTASPGNGGRWRTTPYAIKHQGDRVYAEGINRIIYHRFVHQPWPNDDYLPGLTMGRWGMHFDRTQTWWHLAGEWLRYQARCQWMLQEGRYAADVLFWCGESAPNSGKVALPLPAGYAWDVCATKAVERLTVKNGKIVAPGGVEYEMLVLPSAVGKKGGAIGVVDVDNDEQTMSERMVRKIGELAAAGATIVAPVRPSRAPGLVGWPQSDARVRAAVQKVWANRVWSCSAAEALTRRGIQPDFTTQTPGTVWIHRTSGSADWYFVANGSKTPLSFEVSFRQTGRQPEIWDPETGTIRPADVWRETDGRTVVRLDFRPCGSAFVVFRRPAAPRIVSLAVQPTTVCGETEARHTLVIRKAEYGVFTDPTGKRTVDITAAVAAHVTNGTIDVKIGNALTDKDPAWRKVKTARITYEYDGRLLTKELPEHAYFRVPAFVETIQPPPLVAWRGRDLFAWRPLTATFSFADGTVARASATPPPSVTIGGPWTVSFPQGRGAPPSAEFSGLVCWTKRPEDGIRYFSGTATYVKDVPAQALAAYAPGRRVMLDLGTVKNFAEVTVNGKAFAPLWRPPFRLDITEALAGSPAAGARLEIKVTNLWPNRLIGDDRLYAEDCQWYGTIRQGPKEVAIRGIPQWVKDGRKSPTGRHTFTTWKHWSKEDDLLPSGLIGPVRLWFAEKVSR